MTTRRAVLKGIMASGLLARASWADAGAPKYLSAGRRPNGSYAVYGLSAHGSIQFEIPLPGRGHAAAAHPTAPLAGGVARRPGQIALVLDCLMGSVRQWLAAPKDRHFYGHGAFSADGSLLFTTENDFENAEGRIGVWDVFNGFRRIAEFSSGGVGPHDIRLMPDGAALVVANGGIETHPDSGRAKLNIPTMEPNLSYVSLSGDLRETEALPKELRKNSLRHLAVNSAGHVAIGAQWKGDPKKDVPLVFTHKMGGALHAIEASMNAQSGFEGYVGSVVFDATGQAIAATSPRGDRFAIYDLADGSHKAFQTPDVCGVAASEQGVVASTGQGVFLAAKTSGAQELSSAPVQWDNHLIRL